MSLRVPSTPALALSMLRRFLNVAFIARPEKALLDLVYLTPGGDKEEFVGELRLQNFEQIDRTMLGEFVEKTKGLKLRKAVNNIETIINRGEGIEL